MNNKRALEYGPVKLVIFDWAGTTIDYGSCAPVAAFMEGFRRKGVEVTIAQARGPMGMGKRDHIKAMSQMASVAAAWQAVHHRDITEQDIDEMYNEFAPVLMDVLPTYCQLIPGTVEAVNALRHMGCKIGGTTGYFEEAMALCQQEAAKQGYTPDCSLAATQVPAGRPAPWLIFETMQRLNVFPPAVVVKVGDTVPDIEAGLNAGVWTIGVARTGNGVGLSEREFAQLSASEQQTRVEHARQALAAANAHFVADGIDEVPDLVAQINSKLAQGERP